MPRRSLAFGAAVLASAVVACTPTPQRSSSIPIAPSRSRPATLITPNAPPQPSASATLSPAASALQRGSSSPPGPNLPSLAVPSAASPAPPSYTLPPASPPARDPVGRIVQAPSGLGVTSGGTQGYQTMTTPGGGSAIIVPGGGGTSTVIHAGGLIETVPTPR